MEQRVFCHRAGDDYEKKAFFYVAIHVQIVNAVAEHHSTSVHNVWCTYSNVFTHKIDTLTMWFICMMEYYYDVEKWILIFYDIYLCVTE